MPDRLAELPGCGKDPAAVLVAAAVAAAIGVSVAARISSGWWAALLVVMSGQVVGQAASPRSDRGTPARRVVRPGLTGMGRTGRTVYLALAAAWVAVGLAVIGAGCASTGVRSTVAVVELLGLYIGTQLVISELSYRRRPGYSSSPIAPAVAAPAAASGAWAVVGGRARPSPARWACPAQLPASVVARV